MTSSLPGCKVRTRLVGRCLSSLNFEQLNRLGHYASILPDWIARGELIPTASRSDRKNRQGRALPRPVLAPASERKASRPETRLAQVMDSKGEPLARSPS